MDKEHDEKGRRDLNHCDNQVGASSRVRFLPRPCENVCRPSSVSTPASGRKRPSDRSPAASFTVECRNYLQLPIVQDQIRPASWLVAVSGWSTLHSYSSRSHRRRCFHPERRSSHSCDVAGAFHGIIESNSDDFQLKQPASNTEIQTRP